MQQIQLDTLAREAQRPETSAVNRSWSDVNQLQLLGSFAGMSALYTICAHPINFACTRQQVLRDDPSIMAVLRKAYGSHGLRGIYRGFGLSLFGGMVSDMVLFGTLEPLKEWVPADNRESRDFIAGVAADLVATPTWVPFSVIINRQITAGIGLNADTAYRSSRGTTMELIAAKGWRGLMVGTGISLLAVPTTGMWWSVYGLSKERLYAAADLFAMGGDDSLLGSKTDNPAINAAAGAVTCALISFISNPLWVVRTRLQTQQTSQKIAWVVRDLWLKEGARGFMKGVWGSVLSSTATGVGFGIIYESVKLSADVTRD